MVFVVLNFQQHLPDCDRAKVENLVDLGDRSIQRALGVAWDTDNDSLAIKVDLPDKPLTRRGLLSITNSRDGQIAFILYLNTFLVFILVFQILSVKSI